MNISGNQQYSKATVGLRQKKAIFDQQFRLLFIYPMIIDESLNKYQDLFRDFISVSMGKEIFVSNSLNMVSMASSISPLIDENGEVVELKQTFKGAADVENLVNNHQNLFFSFGPSAQDRQQQVKFDVEQQVKQKTAQIKRLLKVDPIYKQFRPYLEMITLNNFIDVPVIIGTKSLSIKSSILLLVLTVSVASKGKYKLNNPEHITQIFKILKSVDISNLDKLLSNLFDPHTETWWSRIKKKIFSFLSKKFGKQHKSFERIPTQYTPILLKSVQQDLNQAEVFFKLVTDSKALESQIGLKVSNGQLSNTFLKIDPQINDVFNSALNEFIKLWSIYGVPIFKSLILELMPISTPISVSKLLLAIEQGDTSDFSIDINSGILEGVRDILETLKTSLKNNLTKDTLQADKIIKNMKAICNKSLNNNTNIILNKYSKISNVSINTPNFDTQEYIQFEKQLNNIVHSSTSALQEIILQLNNILPKDEIRLLLSKSVNLFQDITNQVAIYLSSNNNYKYQNSRLFDLLRSYNSNVDLDKFVESNIDNVVNYMNFLVFYVIQIAICNYVEQVKVTVKTTKYDILDPMNYTLIIPVETIVGIANAYAAKSLKKIMTENLTDNTNIQQLVSHINNNYIIGIIKYLQDIIEVPNLIVVDELKNTIYYKLMYQSKVMKMKINSISTFIDEIQKLIIQS